MCVAAVLLSQGLVLVDRSRGPSWTTGIGAVGLQSEASGSRDVLSAIAGSMLEVASTRSSITIVVLTLTTSSSTSLYALLVLRSVRSTTDDVSGGGTSTPHSAVLMAVLLAVVCIGVLGFFLRHIPTPAAVPPPPPGRQVMPPGVAETDASTEPGTDRGRVVRADASGCATTRALDTVLAEARRHDLLVRVLAPPGTEVVDPPR